LIALQELSHEFWGSTAPFLILQEIAAKSSKIHQFLIFLLFNTSFYNYKLQWIVYLKNMIN